MFKQLGKFLFGEEPQPDETAEIAAKMAKAAGILNEVAGEARAKGLSVHLSTIGNNLKVSITKEIYSTSINGNITDNPKNTPKP